jgi:hypothetical protein
LGKKTNLRLLESTISTITSQKEAILKRYFRKKFRNKSAKYPELEELFFNLFEHKREHSMPISDEIKY